MTSPCSSVLVWLPIVGGIVVLLLGSGARAQLGKQVALGTSIVTFVLSMPLWMHFDVDSAGDAVRRERDRGSRASTRTTRSASTASRCR